MQLVYVQASLEWYRVRWRLIKANGGTLEEIDVRHGSTNDASIAARWCPGLRRILHDAPEKLYKDESECASPLPRFVLRSQSAARAR